MFGKIVMSPRRRPALRSLAVLAVLAVGQSASSALPAPSPYGVWISPHGNVKVQTKSCGKSLCGTVVWASLDALQKAKAAGTDPLVGVELLRGYRQSSGGLWEGRVFVPDMNRVFFSRLQPLSTDQVKISGCVLGGLLCKSQVWTRQTS